METYILVSTILDEMRDYITRSGIMCAQEAFIQDIASKTRFQLHAMRFNRSENFLTEKITDSKD
jgi:hypothetical protein